MVIRLCKENRDSVLEQVRNGSLDAATLSTSNLIDDIIITMHTNGILSSISKSIPDYRAHNTTIPYELVWASAIAAKRRVKTRLSDIPFALIDHRTLAKLGYTLIDTEGIGQGLMQEGSLRFLIGKYLPDTLISGYNNTVQNQIMPRLNLEANIHILDCTDLEVNYFNSNYEGSGIAHSKRSPSGLDERARGYKLATLRGIIKDTGIIEEIRFGPLNTHDLTLSEEMLRTTPMLKPGDILINDRGFLSRNLINYLKSVRQVDTYVPLRKSMDAFDMAVREAKKKDDWIAHPITRFPSQRICLLKDLGPHWESSEPESGLENVDINACVVWDIETDQYFVFITTDTSKSAVDILKVYNLRPEIEEDYRQLKEFWKLEDFKSTKLNVITFHIVSVLFGYLFFQLYTMMPEGEQYQDKSLPLVLKNYVVKVQGFIVLYVGCEFGIFTLLEVMKLYAESEKTVQQQLDKVLERI